MRYFIYLTVILLLLSGCAQAQMTDIPTATPLEPTLILTETATATLVPPSPSPTHLPPASTPVPTATLSPQPLVVCAQRPSALSPFIPSQANYNVLGFISTYPVDQVGYRWEPRLITHIPHIDNGDVITRSIEVINGASYVDANDVIRIHYGSKPLQLPQMVVTYTLKSGLNWSDGHPLTTTDIVFGYSLAKDLQSYGVWQNLAERTAELSIIDDYRIRWEGIPGYISTNYPGFLFPPQPEHVWKDLSLSQILQDRDPPSTGPYRITDWEDETSITLESNPHYIGQKAVIEKVIFRFPNVKPVFWPEMLRVGTCDIILPGNENNHSWGTWLKLVEQGGAVMWNTPSSTLLRLDFNVNTSDQRTTPLRAIRTRFGLANCVSREHLRELPLGGIAEPAVSFIPALHPAFDPSSIWRVPFNITVGQGILDEVGWRDENGDGIREAHGVDDIRDNTPLTLTLTTSTRHIDAAEIIASDFKLCGVGIVIDAKGPQQLFAYSSASPLYAGDFQLALYSWHATIPDGCNAWSSTQLPDFETLGSDINYGGYINPMLDDACQQARNTVASEQQVQALHTIQEILSDEQQSLFLIWQPRWFVSHPDIRNLQPDISSFSRIYKPETISFKK